MSTHVVTGIQGGLNIGSGDSLLESAGGVINGDVNMTYQSGGVTPGGGGFEFVAINGGVFGSLFDNVAGSGADQIVVSSTGYIDTPASDSYSPIELNGGGHSITNAGTIADAGPAAIYVNGYAGAYTYAGDALVNSGLITAAGPPGYSGAGAVWFSSVASADIVNTGTISASPNVRAVYVTTQAGGAASLTNSGTINGFVGLYAGSVTIRNSGVMRRGVDVNGAGNVVVNDGAIYGDVSLGGAGSLFNSLGGKVYGAITLAGAGKVIAGLNGGSVVGSSGADTLIANLNAGADTQTTLDGGAGHDRLYGGGGQDTFVFQSSAKADSDTIRRFDVASDTIALDHAAFAKLAVGKTPVFVIGPKATSASDHLFYNATSGNLFYDADGSGAGKATLIANLSPGLKLKASDFSVI